jgi:hypothetical protein
MKRLYNELSIEAITEDKILNTKTEQEYYSIIFGNDYEKNNEYLSFINS